MKEWSDAKQRMEAEIQRKKEHKTVGSNFEKARGYVRSNWKTKNFNPLNNPLLEESSTESEEEDNQTEANVAVTVVQGKKANAYNDYGEEDEEIQEGSDYDDDEQQFKMRQVEMIRAEQQRKVRENDARNAKSAHPRMRGKLQESKTQFYDLTKEPM